MWWENDGGYLIDFADVPAEGCINTKGIEYFQ